MITDEFSTPSRPQRLLSLSVTRHWVARFSLPSAITQDFKKTHYFSLPIAMRTFNTVLCRYGHIVRKTLIVRKCQESRISTLMVKIDRSKRLKNCASIHRMVNRSDSSFVSSCCNGADVGDSQARPPVGYTRPLFSDLCHWWGRKKVQMVNKVSFWASVSKGYMNNPENGRSFLWVWKVCQPPHRM